MAVDTKAARCIEPLVVVGRIVARDRRQKGNRWTENMAQLAASFADEEKADDRFR